jgi:oxygen-independent coproporphyrinogen-3 oxidase
LTFKYAREKELKPYYLYRQKNMTDNLENIGYAYAGQEGIYNILMMEERQTILALGAGAVCKFIDYENNRLERLDNVKSLKDYIERIDDMIQKKKDFSFIKGRI